MITFYKYNELEPLSPIVVDQTNEQLTRREIYRTLKDIKSGWASLKRNGKVIEDYQIENNRLTVCIEK